MLNLSQIPELHSNPEFLMDFRKLRGNIEKYNPLLTPEAIESLYNKIEALNNDIHSQKSEELFAMAESVKREYTDLSRIFGKEGERYVEFTDEEISFGMGSLALKRAQTQLPTIASRQKYLNMELENCQKYIELSNLKNSPAFEAIKDALDDIKEGEDRIALNIFDYLDEKNQAIKAVSNIENAIYSAEKNELNVGIMKPIIEEAKNVVSDQLDNISMMDVTTNQAEFLKSGLLKDTLNALNDMAHSETQSIIQSATAFSLNHLKSAQNALAMNYSDAKQIYRQINSVLTLAMAKVVKSYDVAIDAFTGGAYSKQLGKLQEIAENAEINAFENNTKLSLSGRFAKAITSLREPVIRLNIFPDKSYWEGVREQGADLRLNVYGKLENSLDKAERKLEKIEDFLMAAEEKAGKYWDKVSTETIERTDKFLEKTENSFNTMLDVTARLITETQNTAKDTIEFVKKHNAVSASLCRKIESSIDKNIDALKQKEQKIFNNKQTIRNVMDSLDGKKIITPQIKEYVPSEELMKSVAILQNASPQMQETINYKAIVANIKAMEARERLINDFSNLKEVFKADFKNSPFSDPKKTVETLIEWNKAKASLRKENIAEGINKGNIITLETAKNVFEKLAKANEEKARLKEESKSKVNNTLLHDALEHDVEMC